MSAVDRRPWTVKYMVQTFDDVCGHAAIVRFLKQSLANPTPLLGHFIFYGPCGSGKTSLMNCCIEQVFGKSNFGRDCTNDSNFVLRSNASEERCLDDVTKRLKTFAAYQSQESVRKRVRRIVALDEVDSMKEDAQAALHALITQYGDSVCFMMTCNDLSNNLIQPLCSKCVTLHIDAVSSTDMAVMVLKIAERERIECTKEGIEALLLAANGDVRHMLNDFQAAVASNDGRLTESAVLAINHAPPKLAVLRVLEKCRAKELAAAIRLSRHLVEQVGYDVSDVITTMYECVVGDSMFLDGDPRLTMSYQDILKDVMIMATKQKATAITLHGVIAKMCYIRFA